jgi:glycosyltransferase involved in cell wall biosynthesis
MNDVLLTVSGSIDPDIEGQIARGERPLADYVAMAHTFGADLIDYNRARHQGGAFGRLLERVGGPNLLLAWICFRQRRRYRVLFSDGEQVGIPLALMLKLAGGGRATAPGSAPDRPRHLMIGHILSVGKKKPFFDLLAVQSHIDTFFVYSTWQKQYIEKRWSVPPERVVFTPFMVDADFFSPAELVKTDALLALAEQPKPVICAVGLEFRDYPTLMAAARDLDVQVVIAAASPWSKRTDTTEGHSVPENVHIQRFTQFQLRHLYALSQFMVMPLFEVPFQAGVTAILEAMAMEKPVICSRTSGQTDVIHHGENGLYVPPRDAGALRDTIKKLLQQPAEARRLGLAARRCIEEEMSLARYVARLNSYVGQARRPEALVQRAGF